LLNFRLFMNVICKRYAVFSQQKMPADLSRKSYTQIFLLVIISLALGGCSGVFKKTSSRPALLKTENATQTQLLNEVNRFAQVNSLRAKMDLKFEDNSYAEQGIAEDYLTVTSEIVVQRPANILFKVQAPIIGTDVVQMTSDGVKFRLAILEDYSGGKFKKVVSGTNNADYSVLQPEIEKAGSSKNGKKRNINAFSNLRPQHFTDAILIRPIDTGKYLYAQSTISQEEDSISQDRSSAKRVLRGYYLLEEFIRNENGGLNIVRRFWFDRTGGIKLKRQQIFDMQTEIESDILYARTGNLTETGEYNNFPLRIEITRPKERYKISLTYQLPEAVSIGKIYPAKAFVLVNIWNLQEVDLDEKLQEMKKMKTFLYK